MILNNQPITLESLNESTEYIYDLHQDNNRKFNPTGLTIGSSWLKQASQRGLDLSKVELHTHKYWSKTRWH